MRCRYLPVLPASARGLTRAMGVFERADVSRMCRGRGAFVITRIRAAGRYTAIQNATVSVRASVFVRSFDDQDARLFARVEETLLFLFCNPAEWPIAQAVQPFRE